MGLAHSPRIVTDGLALYLDAANGRSYNPNLVTAPGAFNYPFDNQIVATQLDVAPDGTTVLCKHDLTGALGTFMNVRVDRTLPIGTYTISAWVKATTSFSAAFAFVGETTNEVPSTSIAVTSAWQRFVFTFALTAVQNLSRIQIFFSAQGENKVISVWGAEIVAGSTPTPNYITSSVRGDAWHDLSGNGNNGTLLGDPVYTSNNQGVFALDGVDNRFNCGNAAAINFGTGDFTVSLWFRRFANATTNLRLLSKAAGGDGVTAADAGFCFFGANNSLSFGINPTAPRTIIAAATYSLNEWVNVTGLLQRGVSVRTYKNANLTATATAPTGSVSGTTSLFIGDNTGSNLRWAGEVAQVSLYNRALTAAEMAQNFNALRGRFNI